MWTNARLLLLISIAGLLGYSLALAQLSVLDPVRAAPHIFENVLENDHVRVLKATERNGETPPLHALDERLVVYLSPCAWMVESADGTDAMLSFRLGDVSWADAVTRGGKTSNVVEECSRLEIEIK